MKHLYTFLLALALPVLAWAAGWPVNYGGVMLQGFYWDSYSQTGWERFTTQADELAGAFDLIWVPNSGSCDEAGTSQAMGYAPVYWLRHNTCFGTEAQLRTMIKTFKARGTGIVMDAVLNHKNGLRGWVDFAQELVRGQNTGKQYMVRWDNVRHAQICSDDECNQQGYITTGARDEGENFDGARDLDHTNSTTQENVKTYFDFLLHELGYSGFRYDETKGYSPYYTGLYAQAQQPMFGVGEYWDGNSDALRGWLEGTKRNGMIESAVFDYCLKYRINEAFNNTRWSALSDKGLAADENYSRWAVTFVDNHDTGRDDYQKVSQNVAAANAFILALPGTPCIFLSHWLTYKNEIRNCILGRRAAGVTNMSKIITQQESNGGYIVETQGTFGKVYLQLGGATASGTPSGYQLVQSGTNYKFYVSAGLNWKQAPKRGILPAYELTDYPQNGKLTVLVRCDDPNNTHLYAWDAAGNPAGDAWPGTCVATLPHCQVGGATWYYRQFDARQVNVILNNGYGGTGNQTADITGLTANTFITYPATADDHSSYKVVTSAYAPYVGYDVPALATRLDSVLYAYLETSDYAAPRAYAWNPMNSTFAGAWSGTALTRVGTAPSGKALWRWTGPKADSYDFPTKIIFNDGKSGGSQSADLDFVNGGYYTLDGYLGRVAGQSDPADTVYILGQVGSNGGWAPNRGTRMATTDGVTYTATVATTGSDNYFSFTRRLAATATDWSSIASYRFGSAQTAEQAITATDMGTPLPLGSDGSTVAFKIGKGNWRMTVNLRARTLTVTTANTLRGDLNADGKVNTTDVTLLVNAILGGTAPAAYDLDGDARVNTADVTTLVSLILQH